MNRSTDEREPLTVSHAASVAEPATASPTVGRVRSRRVTVGLAQRRAVVVGLGLALIVAVLASLAIGAKSIPIGSVIRAFTNFDPANTDHLVVRELRLPRTVVALLVGVALGVSGAVMQAVTRNPLADPGLLGVNAGASFAVVLAIWGLDAATTSSLVWFAMLGAAVASVIIYLLGSVGRGGATPVRLALSGAALSALLYAFTRRSRCSTRRRWISTGSGRSARSQAETSMSPAASCGSSSAVSFWPRA